MSSLQLRRAVAIAVALALAPLGLTACGAPAVVQESPTTQPTTVPEIDEEKEDGEPATGFVDVFDDSSTVTVQVPESWTQVDGTAVTTAAGVQILNIIAAPDIDAYNNTWTSPGVTVGATQDFSQTPQSYLDSVLSSVGPECDDGETDLYDDGVYTGNYLYLPNCGVVGTEFLAVAATDADLSHIVIVQIQMVSEEDKTTTRDAILSTFLALF